MAKKLMISVDEDLLADIEDYAKRMHLNRSASFSVLCSTALQAQKSMNILDELVQAYRAEKMAQQAPDVENGVQNPTGPDKAQKANLFG